MKKKYIVWVGGIPNYFKTLNDAQIEKLKWINKGYDDLIIETIKENDNDKEQQRKVLNNIFDIYGDVFVKNNNN